MKKIFKKPSLVLVLSLFTVSFAHAASESDGDSLMRDLGNSFYQYYTKPGLDRIKSVANQMTSSDTAENNRCQAFYAPLVQKQNLRIHMSFGYFDDSTGSPYLYSGKNLGMNSSMDRAFYYMFTKILQQPCQGNMALCAFHEGRPGQFLKSIKSPSGAKVSVEIDTENASLTPYHELNTNEFASEQQQRSNNSREAFLNAMTTDDVVFYVGHSRNGGGPDFYPPHLLSDLKVNYHGYYQDIRPGYHDVVNELSSHQPGPALVGIFSCVSEYWFGGGFANASPHSGFIFTPSDLFAPMTDVFAASVASLDSLLRFQCYDGMSSELQAVRSLSNYNVHVRNFLSNKHPVDKHAELTATPPD